MTDPAPGLPDHLTIRPPLQERSRRAWDRVLDAGVILLEEAGYEGFTIAAVCERAQVSPRAVYDRAPSKDALFLAVYERGMARIKADLRPIAAQITHPGTDVDTVLRTWFTTVFSALVIRVAYGPGFAADPVDDATYTSQLARMSSLYLLTGRQFQRSEVTFPRGLFTVFAVPILAPTAQAISRSQTWPASWVCTGCHHSAS